MHIKISLFFSMHIKIIPLSLCVCTQWHILQSVMTGINAALAEFHRQRAARFVRLVKERTDRATWDDLRRQHPELLTNVIMGRSIRWEELDTAEHPQLGQGRPQVTLRGQEQQFIERLFTVSSNRQAVPLARQASLMKRSSRLLDVE
jgi:hypothetical protein